MARSEATRLIVVDRGHSGRLLGVIALHDLLRAYRKNLDTEELREATFFVPMMRRRNGHADVVR
jgi:CBS domain-containing protein